MCLPLAAVALAISAVGVGVSAYGSSKTSQAQQQNSAMQGASADIQKRISDFNAQQALAYGDINAKQTLSLAGINDSLTQSIGDMNVQIAQATTDFNSSIHEGNAQIMEAQGNAQGQVHEVNARLDEQNARFALDQGNQQEQVSRAQYAGLKSQQRASFASAGVALDEGTALRVQTDTEYESRVDAATIKANALRTAWGYRVDWANETAAAAYSRTNGQAAALTERGQAMTAQLASEVQIAGTKMSTSFTILQNDMNSRISAENTRNQAYSDAWNASAQGQGYASQAAAARTTAAGINPGLSAASTLLSGAGQVATQWYSASRSGAFG